MEGIMNDLDRRVLTYLSGIGLLEVVPTEHPGKGKVLARSVCFLHDDADNPHGFMLFADGFVCSTANCHKKGDLGSNLPGLIRRMVCRLTGEPMDWPAAWSYARTNPAKLKSLVGDAVSHAKNVSTKDSEPYVSWSADELAACLKVPDPYFLNRGFRCETLMHFGVGRCVRLLPDKNHGMLGWSIIPVTNFGTMPFYGYTARNPRWVDGGVDLKWCHGLKRSRCLFNMRGAMFRGPLVIVEGPCDAMRLWEGGVRGGVAVFSNSLSDGQYGIVLSLLGYDREVIIAPDNDDAGREFATKARARLQGVCNPVVLHPPARYHDVGEMPAEQVAGWMASVFPK